MVTERWIGCKLKLGERLVFKNTDEAVSSNDEGELLCVQISVT